MCMWYHSCAMIYVLFVLQRIILSCVYALMVMKCESYYLVLVVIDISPIEFPDELLSCNTCFYKDYQSSVHNNKLINILC